MKFDEMLQSIFDAIKHRDLNKLFSTVLLDEDVVMIIPNGAFIKGRAAVANLHTVWFADPDWQMDLKILRSIETPEMGFALIQVDPKDINLSSPLYNNRQYLSLVFTRKDDKWFLVNDQTTSVV
ncbi:MAG: hypothetical protein NVS4B11_15200 [Ktedonobacteraceae bacterium]